MAPARLNPHAQGAQASHARAMLSQARPPLLCALVTVQAALACKLRQPCHGELLRTAPLARAQRCEARVLKHHGSAAPSGRNRNSHNGAAGSAWAATAALCMPTQSTTLTCAVAETRASAMRRQGYGAGGCNTQQPQCAGRGGRDLLCVQDPCSWGCPGRSGAAAAGMLAPREVRSWSPFVPCAALGAAHCRALLGTLLVAGQARVT